MSCPSLHSMPSWRLLVMLLVCPRWRMHDDSIWIGWCIVWLKSINFALLWCLDWTRAWWATVRLVIWPLAQVVSPFKIWYESMLLLKKALLVSDSWMFEWDVRDKWIFVVISSPSPSLPSPSQSNRQNASLGRCTWTCQERQWSSSFPWIDQRWWSS